MKGDKTHPVITYDARQSSRSMRDVVTYQKNGKERSIKGVDRQISDKQFRWRGSALLALITSDWKIDHLSNDDNWMIISFQKSLFTPKANDILARGPMISPLLAAEMLEVFESLHRGQTLQHVYHTNLP
ncbi:hypothetical protein [Phragmitibacter flavus]|uniref:hypothetical protein n=1 Tax=Phragmitibacter flavus TaxID=2576071 RepID=UPI0010FDEED1|nr:hypothetical protein [Phragmitibacter flavus]